MPAKVLPTYYQLLIKQELTEIKLKMIFKHTPKHTMMPLQAKELLKMTSLPLRLEYLKLLLPLIN
jgi:hypothetical protein